MPVTRAHRPARLRAALAVSAAALLLIGCAPTTVESGSSGDVAESPAREESAREELLPEDPALEEPCSGVRVVVEFGALGGAPETGCAQTETEITAAEAFRRAGIELTEGQAYPGAICRVAGRPAADTTLTYGGETYREDCDSLGPIWAYWGLFVSADASDESGAAAPATTWVYADAGVGTQLVASGDAVAFAWQFGDTSVPQLPTL